MIKSQNIKWSLRCFPPVFQIRLIKNSNFCIIPVYNVAEREIRYRSDLPKGMFPVTLVHL